MSDLPPSHATSRPRRSALPPRSHASRTGRSPLRLIRGRRLFNLVAIAALFSGVGTLVGFSVWTSAVLILQPHPPRWLVQALPYWSKGWSDVPTQTLAAIEADLALQERTAGELMDLSLLSPNSPLRGLYLLPVLATASSCTSECEAIVEVRLYGLHHRDRQTLHLQLLDQLQVMGPSEEQVVDPLRHGDVGTFGSTYTLPLNALKPLQAEGLSGGWLTLTGRWRNQGSPVLYGQLLYVDPQTLRIGSLLNWQSPPGRLPIWYNLDANPLPELVVNQSVGLEPSFRIYTVHPVTSATLTTRLQEVVLNPVTLPPEMPTPPYTQALFLAQHGLWSEAERRLTALKQQFAEQWTLELEQQWQLLSLHAQFSQSQADRDWSQPSQKLLALLLDGQWQTAMKTVDSTAQSGFDRAVLPLLERDSSRLWQRLSAFLKVYPDHQEARLWGALVLLVKEDKQTAVQWLHPNPNTPLQKEFEAILTRVAPAASPAGVPPATPGAAPVTPAASPPPWEGLWGTARSVASIDPQRWQVPTTRFPTLPADHQWYIITLQAAAFQQQWRDRPPTPANKTPAAIAAYLQSLNLGPNQTLQLLDTGPDQASQTVQVRGVQWQGTTVSLLASGPALKSAGPLMAVIPSQWGTPATTPGQSLGQFLQTQADLSDRLLLTLNQHLGVDAESLMAALSTPVGNEATVHQAYFTGRAQPESLLTLPPAIVAASSGAFSSPATVTLIVDPQGHLLYSNLWTGGPTTLVGWLRPPAGATALVTRQGDRLELLAWSAAGQRFE